MREELRDNTVPFEKSSQNPLFSFCKSIAVNNTVMTSFTDYGYLKLFYTFYNLSHLEQYPNFFVTVIDHKSYEVRSNSRSILMRRM